MRAAAVLGVGLVAAAPVMAGGCGDSYSALFDSLPIALTRAPMGGGVAGDGALLAIAASPEALSPSYRMVVSTGASVTLLAGDAPVGTPATEKANFNLLDAPGAIADRMTAAVRGQFRGVSVLYMPLHEVG